MPQGRILSGWMSDKVGRINVLRTMIAISMVAMPLLYAVGGNVALLYLLVVVVYWCYGTQLSVNGAATADFWGPRNARISAPEKGQSSLLTGPRPMLRTRTVTTADFQSPGSTPRAAGCLCKPMK